MYVYKYEKKNKFEQPFLSFQGKHIFIGNSKNCEKTEFSTANDNLIFDGKTILLECEDNEEVYVSGFEIFNFKTDDKIIDYISLFGNNMCPYTIANGEKHTYFIYDRYKFIENDKIEEGTLLNATNGNLDPFVYHLKECGKDVFKMLERSQIQSCWPRIEEDENVDLIVEGEDDLVEEDEDLNETNYCNGNKEVVKVFNQKCVLCYERYSVYAFRQCGHQCICDQCYQNKGDFDIIKCVLCRTSNVLLYVYE